MDRIDVSVVVCTRNRSASLDRLLSSLDTQILPAAVLPEIVLVDNGSSDGTAELVAEFAKRAVLPVRYTWEERPGVAVARNCGVREAKGEWIAFIDDDETADTLWLFELLNAAKASGVDVVGGRLALAVDPQLERRLAGTARKHLDETFARSRFDRAFNYCGPGTGNVLIRRRVFERIGLFAEELPVRGEDQDFFRRARAAGVSIATADRALVLHHLPLDRLTPDALHRVARTNGQSLAYFDRRYRGLAITLAIAALRTGHALGATVPRLVAARIRRDRAAADSHSCSLATARSYIAEASRLLG